MSRNGWTLAFFSVALLVLVSASVSAETDVYASGVVQGKYRYHTGDDVESSASDTRLELDVGIGEITLGAVYRAYQLTDESDLKYFDQSGVKIPDAAIKHRYVALEHDDLYARAGHFQVTFGRGLALRSYEDVDLEYDTLLDGFMAEYDAGIIGVTALSGVTGEDDGDRFYSHTVRGARVDMHVSDWMEIAGSVVERAWDWEDETGLVDLPSAELEDGLVGGEVSMWLGPLTVAAEYVDRDGRYLFDPKEYPEVDGELRGHATYAAATLDLGLATLFGEVKDYDDIEHRMINPPTCVRDHQYTLMNRATYQPDLNDERGFLFEGSGSVGEDLYLTGGASEARNHDSDLLHWEMFGQATYGLGDGSIGFGGSMSREYEYKFVAGEITGKFTEHVIGAAEAEFPVWGEHFVELVLEAQAVEDTSGDTSEDYLLAAAWYAGLDLTVTAAVEGTTAETESGRTRWTMVSVKRALAGDLEVELSAGTERAGKKCAGGTCTFEPEFEGVRLRFTKFF